MIDSGPTVAPIKFALGETWSAIVTCNNSDGGLLDLTGALAVKWRVANSEGVWLDAFVGHGIAIDGDPTTGVITIAIPEAMQDGISTGSYQHELRVTTADGAVLTQMVGTLEVIESLFATYIKRPAIGASVGAAGCSAIGATA